MAIIEAAAGNILGDVVQKLLGIKSEIEKVNVRFQPTRYHQVFTDSFTYSDNIRPQVPTWKYRIDSKHPRTVRDINVLFEDDVDASAHKPYLAIEIDNSPVLETLGGNPYRKGFPAINFRNGKVVRRESEIKIFAWNQGDGAGPYTASVFFTLGEV